MDGQLVFPPVEPVIKLSGKRVVLSVFIISNFFIFNDVIKNDFLKLVGNFR